MEAIYLLLIIEGKSFLLLVTTNAVIPPFILSYTSRIYIILPLYLFPLISYFEHLNYYEISQEH